MAGTVGWTRGERDCKGDKHLDRRGSRKWIIASSPVHATGLFLDIGVGRGGMMWLGGDSAQGDEWPNFRALSLNCEGLSKSPSSHDYQII